MKLPRMILGAALAALVFTPSSVFAAKTPPGANPLYSSVLSQMDLEIPVSNGSGGVVNITTLTSNPNQGFNPGYASFFYCNDNGTYIDFEVPPNGATTSGSSDPRTELKQKSNVRWIVSSGTHTMTGKFKILQLPNVTNKGMMTVAQIHNNISDNGPLLKLEYYFKQGTPYLYTEHRLQPTKTSTQFKTGPKYTLPVNTEVFYEITLTASRRLTVKVRPNGGSWTTICDSQGSAPLGGPLVSAWGSQTCYFKAGCYMHDASTSSTPVAKVRYYHLTIQ